MKKALVFRRNLIIATIILFVGTFFLPSLEVESRENQASGNILVYGTWDGGGWYDYTFYNDDLPNILENHGYSVTVTDRILTPTITAPLLAQYDQLWILNTEYSWSGSFSQTEINTILDFRVAGHGLLISADHTEFAYDVNQISVPLGVTFYGLADHGGPQIAPVFETHPLFSGVTTIHGNNSEAFMLVNSPADVVATYQGDDIIAVSDDGMGRVVFDNTFCRFWDGATYILIGNTPQYVRNIADWLMNVPNQPPTAVIEYIGPNPAEFDHPVICCGHGTDDGSIQAYNWRTNEGVLSTEDAFVTISLPLGQNTIYFKVQDDQGVWSPEVSQRLVVMDPAAADLADAIDDLYVAVNNYCASNTDMYAYYSAYVLHATVGASGDEISKLLTPVTLESVVEGSPDGLETLRILFSSQSVPAAVWNLVKGLILQIFFTTVRAAFATQLRDMAESINPDTWDLDDIRTAMETMLNGDQGYDYSGGLPSGPINGLGQLQAWLQQQKDNLVIPPELPPNVPTQDIINKLHIATDKFREATPPSETSPVNEVEATWVVDGVCYPAFDHLGNPVFLGTTSSAVKTMELYYNSLNYANAIDAGATYGCAAWAIGGAVVKIIAFLTGPGELVAEGVYWKGITACGFLGVSTEIVKTCANCDLIAPLLDGTAKYTSDMTAAKDFYGTVLSDIGDIIENNGATVSCGRTVFMSPDFPPMFQYTAGQDPDADILEGVFTVPVVNPLYWLGAGKCRVVAEYFANGVVMGSSASDVATITAPLVFVSFDATFLNPRILPDPVYQYMVRLNFMGGSEHRVYWMPLPRCQGKITADTVYTRLANGSMLTGDSVQVTALTQPQTYQTCFYLSSTYGDVDLHLYDTLGNHVGINYQTDSVEVQIPGAFYSGDTPGTVEIRVVSSGDQRYSAKVIVDSAVASCPYDLIMVEEEFHPAQIAVRPHTLSLYGEPGDSIKSMLMIYEVGGHEAATGPQVQTTDLVRSGSDTIPASQIAIDLTAPAVPADSGVACLMTVAFPEGLPVGTYTGTATVAYSGGSVDVPIILSGFWLSGDVNADGVINVTDVVYLINYLFLVPPGPAPIPPEAGDVNCDAVINVTDVVYLINYLFLVPPGPPPGC